MKPECEVSGGTPPGAREKFTASLEQAIECWGDTVLRLATSRTGNASDAEDVFQTVFLRLYQTEKLFRGNDHLKAWLLRVTVNCCNDLHRSPWHKRQALYDHEVTSIAEAIKHEPSDDLATALARLSPKQRSAVHLFYFEGYPTDEIAQITGESSATVRSHLHRARKALKIDLGAPL